ncbi:MAG: type IV-A pilus assembly ATPase PilB [Gammaproteobacteria bacterium]|nr:type IV-A pilus assembly ATPase PilB [Gammaproteobacteria bacterium]MDE2346546.1 type IV-A pilus assembly ATPase PilB [Gammaproteobacteria bacterium]
MATTTVRINLTGLPRRLVADGILNEAQALDAQRDALQEKLPLVSYLVRNLKLNARAIAFAASDEFGVPLLDLDAVDMRHAPLKEMEAQLMENFHVLPLYRRGRRIFMGVSDPATLPALDQIRFNTGLTVDAVVVEEDKLVRAIEKAIRSLGTSIGDLDEEINSLDTESANEYSPDDDENADVEDAPVVRFVNKIMLDAINRNASDIHFEPYEKFYRIRLRQDGMLQEIAQPPVNLAMKIAARLKVMSRLDISERRIPQDGRIKLKLSKSRSIDFRVNTCPTLWGEKIVMRILDPSSAKLGIDALGYEDFQKEHYLRALARPYGMILVTGPTGSGKTVSLYTGVNILNTKDRNICTAEDPVEIQLPGVNQVNVHPKVGLTFASALRAFLRQDPDVILVGEIRDLETAEIAVKAAQTGHLVLSTLHTNDAPKTLSRLADIGVPPYSIATAVNLIIAQRLARKLCEACKRKAKIPKEALLKEGFSEQEIKDGVEIYEPVGCDQCAEGYKGRTGIYQVLPVTESISRLIMQGGGAIQIADQALKEGVWDLRKSGLHKVRNGVTSLVELNRVTTE